MRTNNGNRRGQSGGACRGDLIVHIFLPETRDYYNIDELLAKIAKRPVQENER